MKVLIVNGSPHPKGTTAFALSLVEEELNAAGIETVMFQVGTKPLAGCIACGSCRKTGKCVFDDCVNEAAALVDECDGFVFGAPTYYANASGQMRSFLDRLFYSKSSSSFKHKVCAVVTAARRAGTLTALDELLKYPTISQMVVATSSYWPMIFGNSAEEAAQDEEGVDIMRTLGQNMAWIMKSIDAAKAQGIEPPVLEHRRLTNFIR